MEMSYPTMGCGLGKKPTGVDYRAAEWVMCSASEIDKYVIHVDKMVE